MVLLDTGGTGNQQSADRKKPAPILWLQIMLGIDAVFSVTSYFLLRSMLSLSTVDLPTTYTNVLLIIALLEIVVIYGLYKRAYWAFIAAIVIFALNLAINLLRFNVIGIGISALIIFYAIKAKPYFKRTSQQSLP